MLLWESKIVFSFGLESNLRGEKKSKVSFARNADDSELHFAVNNGGLLATAPWLM